MLEEAVIYLVFDRKRDAISLSKSVPLISNSASRNFMSNKKKWVIQLDGLVLHDLSVAVANQERFEMLIKAKLLSVIIDIAVYFKEGRVTKKVKIPKSLYKSADTIKATIELSIYRTC